MKAFAQLGTRVVALVLVALPLVWMVVSYRDAQLGRAKEMEAALNVPLPKSFQARDTIMRQIRTGDVPPPQVGDANLVAKRAH